MLPGLDDSRGFGSPLACKFRKSRLGPFSRRGGIDGPQISRHRLAPFPTDKVQAVPDQMYDAQLHGSLGMGGFDRFLPT